MKVSRRKPPSKDPPKIKECLFCGGTHALERKLCPASGQKCKKCGKERMLLRLQRYNLDVKYQKGSLLVMSDPLSRAYLDEPPTQTEFCNELEEIVLVKDLPNSEARLKEFKEGTASDDNRQILMSTVLEGLLNTLDEVPAEIKPYFQFRDEITTQNGLLFKGERLIVPTKLRKEMMEKVHSSHLGIGIEGCLRRAREVFYWSHLNAELDDFILKCDICSLYKPAQPREPLIPLEIPSRPWHGSVLV